MRVKLNTNEHYKVRYECREKGILTLEDRLSELDEEDRIKSSIEEVKYASIARENEDEPITEKDRLDIISNEEELKPNLSYDAFVQATVPIGYKFECEEEKSNKKELPPVVDSILKGLNVKETPIVAIKAEELSVEEMKALIGDGYLYNEELRNRMEQCDYRKVIDEVNESKDSDGKINEDEEEYIPEQCLTKNVNHICNLESEKSRIGYDMEYSNVDKIKQDLVSPHEENRTLSEVHIKSEKEKMLSGESYIAWGDEFVNERKRARKLLQEFNSADPEDRRLTYGILKKLLGGVGEYIHIEPNFKCTYGNHIKVGENFYAGFNCVILDQAYVTIGCNCIISPQVGIYTLAYPEEKEKRIAGYEYAKPITIGDNVWIGGGSIINPGVKIGDNVVILPGSVVNKDIPNNVVVEGNPANIVRNINN